MLKYAVLILWRKKGIPAKGLASHVQAKKISQGLVGFGCNLAQLIAYLCRPYSPVGTQIQQRQQSKVWHFILQPAERKKSFLGCKDSNQKCLSYDDKTGFHATMHHLA